MKPVADRAIKLRGGRFDPLGAVCRLHADPRAVESRDARADGIPVFTAVRDRRSAPEDASGDHPSQRAPRARRNERSRILRNAHTRVVGAGIGRTRSERRGDVGRAARSVPGAPGSDPSESALQQRPPWVAASPFHLRRSGHGSLARRSVKRQLDGSPVTDDHVVRRWEPSSGAKHAGNGPRISVHDCASSDFAPAPQAL
jgi:hypothetical protein